MSDERWASDKWGPPSDYGEPTYATPPTPRTQSVADMCEANARAHPEWYRQPGESSTGYAERMLAFCKGLGYAPLEGPADD